jgi:flagellar protein FlaG
MPMPDSVRLPGNPGALQKGEKAHQPVQEPDTEHLKALAADVQKNLQIMHNVDLQFSVHEASGRMMVVVKEESSGKVIREIPAKEVLNLAAKLDEMIGLLVDKKG